MTFLKYQHIEKYNTPATKGICDGICYVCPKLDGTNAQLWFQDGILHAGGRKRELSLDNDNAGFFNWASKNPNILNFFEAYPNFRLYGEWLVPHTLKTYQSSAWRKFYVFDVMDGENYLPYEDYVKILGDYEIEYIPVIAIIKNPTEKDLLKVMEENTYLIENAKGVGEGIVLKNYSYKNRYGDVVWAKIVKNDFQWKHKSNHMPLIREYQHIENKIANEFVTTALVEKEFAKINNAVVWTSKQIPRLLNTIYYCLITEEAWNFVKKYKNPAINFKDLQRFTTQRIKEIKPELF